MTPRAESSSTKYDQLRGIVRGERLPLFFVDLDAFDRNLKMMVEMVRGAGKTLRVATKSLRVPALIQRVLRADPAVCRGVLGYAAGELEVLGDLAQNFLLAYPTVQAADLAILKAAHERTVSEATGVVQMVVDCEEHLRALVAAGCGSRRHPFGVVVELDVALRPFERWFGHWPGGGLHLGVRRSPIRTVTALERFCERVWNEYPTLRVDGVMAYEAQVAGLGDKNPLVDGTRGKQFVLNAAAHWVRRRSVEAVAILRREVRELFARRGWPLTVFNGGGSGSLNFSVREPALTEVSAGSGLFAPHLFDYYSNIRFEPAAFFALQAVRVPAAGFVTCAGGGYVASGAPGVTGRDRLPVPFLPDGASLLDAEGAGEVQTPVQWPISAGAPAPTIQLGDPIFFRHAKAGELAERFNEVILWSNGTQSVRRAPTYRGMGKAFL